MEFIRLKAFINEEKAEEFTALILSTGIDSFELNGGAVIYLPYDKQGEEVFYAAQRVLVQNRIGFDVNYVREEDWENNWKQYFKPFKAGKFIIKPPWEQLNAEADALILEIDPGSAFGTGQHDTTRLCIELIGEHLKKGDAFLDIGCGSGILSAAAFLLGAGKIAAVDISETALKVAAETFRLNKVSEYSAYLGDVTCSPELRRAIGSDYRIVAANITADVIIGMSGVIAEFAAPGAKLLLSGIILPQLKQVKDALESAGFRVLETRESNGWGALVCNR